MKNKTHLKSICIMIFLILTMISFTALAADSYVIDKANVLSKNIITTSDTNLEKLQKNTGAQVRIYILKTLDGKNITSVAQDLASKEKSNKYAIFVVSIADHKNKFLVGSGLNNVFSESELNRIASLPNEYFKKKDFDKGIVSVAKQIDQDITSKAIQSGKVVVKTDGYSKTVEPKKSHIGVIIFMLFLILSIGIFIYYIKRKNEKEAKEFARRNNLNYDKGFRSTKMEEVHMNNENLYKPNITSSSKSTNYSRPNHSNQNYSEPVHHTTIINNGNNGSSDLVTGMMLNEMMHGHHEHYAHHDDNYEHHQQYNDNSRDNYNSDNNVVSSGDWDSSSDSSDNDNCNYYSNSDDNDKSSSGSWGSSSDTSSWGSSDSGSSDWSSSDCGSSDCGSSDCGGW